MYLEKKTFVRKIRTFNVDEIDGRSQSNQTLLLINFSLWLLSLKVCVCTAARFTDAGKLNFPMVVQF
jgi:hypothetical protein